VGIPNNCPLESQIKDLIPPVCFAERRYGGVMKDALLMAIPSSYLPKVIQGLEALSRNGLRFPIPQYGVNNDVRAGMGVSYADKPA